MEIVFHAVLEAGAKFYWNSRGWLIKTALRNWIRSKTLKLARTLKIAIILIILKDAGFLCMLRSTKASSVRL